MKNSLIKTQNGVGFIEVLIATAVVALGLLANASLQGNFMSSSGVNKTRAEAQTFAEQKLETLKNNVIHADYAGLVSGTESLTGSNASFTRRWRIANVDPTPVPTLAILRTISVQVGWDGNGDGDRTDPDEVVNVVTEMAWINPADAALYAQENIGGTSGAVSSPRQNASEDVASVNVLGGVALVATGGASGVTTTLNVTIPSKTSLPVGGCGTTSSSASLQQVATGSHFYTLTSNPCVESGVIAVFQCITTTTTTCTHIQNHFGGVVLRIAGTVYSMGNADRFIGSNPIRVAWSSDEVHSCYNGAPIRTPVTGTWKYDAMPYECVFAGNCSAMPVDSSGSRGGGCFGTGVVTNDQITNKRRVGPGGEYGEVGLLDIRDSAGSGGLKREEVCFLEDTTTTITPNYLIKSGNTLNSDYLYPVTKRLYVVKKIVRENSLNKLISEGINRSYFNHNFLVIERSSNSSNHCNELVGGSSPTIAPSLAPRQIVRTLNASGDNKVLDEATYPGVGGVARTYTGTVDERDSVNLSLFIDDIGSCYLNNNSTGSTPTSYACVAGISSSSYPTIKGVSQSYPTSGNFGQCTQTSTLCSWKNNY